ncbi:hypothetical protein HYFRA_00002861 [Hymenoscyphus fraxineus]|uniref:Carboxylic ester hydrolase n=1 Tax=Hymenoscyphus fraxineus TaxID=746836 RepID=A0A9N9KNZ3_9HELO|nr:hypothetical protein HYFRA_00002861 [Hymenoscyphus fraxineus]
MKLFSVLTACFLPFAYASQTPNGCPTFTIGQLVNTSSGTIVGHAAPNHPEVSEYLGIPFGQAPVRDLRFAAPVKYVGSSIINASTFGFSCVPQRSSPPSGTYLKPETIAASNITAVGLQFFNLVSNPPGVAYDEDCLFLNVWSKPQTGERKKAVMVFIHGGGFNGGTSSLPIQNGAALADKEDVIIVSFKSLLNLDSYRLSILGFPGNPDTQNNLAILDQRLAMEFVRDNIENFGGDPARITLFGQSAGAMSTDFYSYAWASDPIAAGIIAQSGTVHSFGLPYTQEAAASNWYNTTAALGCGNASTNSTEILTCMRKVEVDALMSAIPNTGLNAILSPFGPTADNSIIFSNYTQRTPASIPILLGNTDYEGGLFRTQLALANTTFPDWAWDAYNLAGFTCPSGLRANHSLASNNPTWRYRYHGIFPNTNISSEGGAYHGAELPILFGTADLFGKSTAIEEEIASYIQGAWTTFAKDPTKGLLTYGEGWPLYDPTKETLVRLAYEDRVGSNLAFPLIYAEDEGCRVANFTALIYQFLGPLLGS